LSSWKRLEEEDKDEEAEEEKPLNATVRAVALVREPWTLTET
jgi:hypothetical protein